MKTDYDDIHRSFSETLTYKDFTPTKETISLHGLGFIQVKLGGSQRLHVWHPDLPRRSCYEYSSIHNHRFGFTSCVLKGTQINIRCRIEIVKQSTGSHLLISHNGPRSEKGGRESYPVADVNIEEMEAEYYGAGEEYTLPVFEYHKTPNKGIVITVLKKEKEQNIHANSVIERGHSFHYDFDRFQLSPEKLYGYVIEAFQK